MTRSDAELLLALKEGDAGAFDAIVERFQRRLIGYFHRMSGDAQLAEDCAQEVFVRLWRARENYVPSASAVTFVMRIARNHWIDRYRSRAARPPEASLDRGEDERRWADAIAGGGPSPAQVSEQREDERRLLEALLRIPESQRSVLDLAGRQNLRYEDIAAILDIPVGTVKSRVFAAVAKLRQLLRANEPDEGGGS